ncbi:methyltransferase domain-containing protein [Streptomyces eurocidicus]|uniref:SAM-dependent methyltransferase n=1 Tax=Streptomyces eurocidicus TaxID=66423 RepID=A0A7W8F6E0_STREU|nr:50S ribosomal protein L11 methyltransferase [Streptomyces eurocidicus]MBB5122266.1 SAM-dependent methyltransferase [Streptomyces eurocidicus]MBF6055150.1 methyltransferase domain-containing protein [Streptomyces eurocidicus]
MTTPDPGPVTELLRRTAFADRVEHARRRSELPWAPWPPAAAAPSGDTGAALWNLLHRGRRPDHRPDPALVSRLAALGLSDASGAPGRWEATAFRGLLAVRDRAPGGSGDVYIGEDSLRFVDTILRARPTGRALDVGCGSGITTCALALGCAEVTGADLQRECVDATALSAALNGLGDRVRTWHGDFFRDYAPDAPLNCVVANLPYVPVPPGLGYSPAGNGGPDGLDLNRRLLRRAAGLLDPADGLLVTRFQSLGDASGPLLLPDIEAFAKEAGHDVTVVADGRTVPEVRAALTALLALRHNPELSADEVLATVDAHMRRFGQPHYFACGMVSRSGGTGVVTFTDLSGPLTLDDTLTAGRGAPAGATAAALRLYRGRALDLPDGFWELGTAEDVAAPERRLPALLGAVADAGPAGITGRDLAAAVFADRFEADPLRSRALLVTTELMAGCLTDEGLVEGGSGR